MVDGRICQYLSAVLTELLASSALSDDSDNGQPFKRVRALRAAEQQQRPQQHGTAPAYVASPLKPLVTRRSAAFSCRSEFCAFCLSVSRSYAKVTSVHEWRRRKYTMQLRHRTCHAHCACLDSRVLRRSRERSKTVQACPAKDGFLGSTSLELGTVEALADLKGVAQGIAQAHAEPTPLDRLAATADLG